MPKADGSSQRESTSHLEALTKEELVGLVELYARFFVAIDGFWYMAAKDFVDVDTAIRCDLWVWDKYSRYEVKRLMPFAKAEGNDLAAFATVFSLSPWLSSLDHSFTQQGENELTFTVKECPTLQALEREGDGRERAFCSEVEPLLFQRYVQAFSPSARAIPIELPPASRASNICCRWRISM